jgi:hypothetical protein
MLKVLAASLLIASDADAVKKASAFQSLHATPLRPISFSQPLSIKSNAFSPTRIPRKLDRSITSPLAASTDDKNENQGDIWSQQKQLLSDFNSQQASSLKAEQLAKFQKRQLGLVGDTAFFSAMIFCALWLVCDNPFVSLSYSLGATLGLAYSYGLGKYVETIGASIDDEGVGQGAGIGNARFAFLILLFVVVGKFKSVGLLEIPAIMGFFTYQLGSLSQGLREIND